MGLAAATVARGLTTVRNFHRWLVLEELRPDDPTVTVELPRVPLGLPKALSEAEAEALMAAPDAALEKALTAAPRGARSAASKAEPLGPEAVARLEAVACRDRAILETLYGTGVRVSELVGLSLGDVDLASASMRVLGKGAKERVLPLGRLARAALGEWLSFAGRGRDGAGAVGLPVRRRGGVPEPARHAAGSSRGLSTGKGLRGRPKHRLGAHTSRAAPQFRHAPAEQRCRHPHCAGVAGPRPRHHHADLHRRVA